MILKRAFGASAGFTLISQSSLVPPGDPELFTLPAHPLGSPFT